MAVGETARQPSFLIQKKMVFRVWDRYGHAFHLSHVHMFEQVHIVSGVFVAKKYDKPAAAPAPEPAVAAAEPPAKAATPAPNGQSAASVAPREGGEY